MESRHEINIKLKTMDNAIHEVLIKRQATIKDLKEAIEKVFYISF